MGYILVIMKGKWNPNLVLGTKFWLKRSGLTLNFGQINKLTFNLHS